MNEPVLTVENLRVEYQSRGMFLPAVDEVSFTLHGSERLGLVGESGSGKSTVVSALMGLIRSPGRVARGRVLLKDMDLLSLNSERMRRVRFARLSLIPQGAMNSLNPVIRIRPQIVDILQAHGERTRSRDVSTRLYGLLEAVQLPRQVLEMYPHELSGGMKQRVCIAMAIALRPEVILADEPTSALDVVVQRQIIETLERVQQEIGAAVVLVGHDMGLMAQFVDRIAVMYAGRLVEVGDRHQILTSPRHPYTRLLIQSLPNAERRGELKGIPGVTPSLRNLPTGCRFHPRCPWAVDACRSTDPAPIAFEDGGTAACIRMEDVAIDDARTATEARQ